MRIVIFLGLVSLLSGAATAQVNTADRPFEDGYDNQLLYVHALVNYAFDLEWQYDWEREQFSANVLRVNTGSVSSSKLLTDIDFSFNEPLNEKWRFSGQFNRDGQRQRPIDTEQLLIGFERALFDGSAVFVTVNPEYDKSALDVAVGYALYRDARQQYLRVSLLLDDTNYGSKNAIGGSQQQDPLYLQWAARWGIADGWFVYSEGRVGRGFERSFDDVGLSPELARFDQQDNRAELRISKRFDDGRLWSFWAEWADFEETRQFRTPGLDYQYTSSEINIAAEHVRLLSERRRLRVLAHFVDRQAESVGFNGHDFDRRDVVGGAFYEYLRSDGALMLGYAFGLPDFDYVADDAANNFSDSDYTDKLIVGWRYSFSPTAQVRASLSHEISAQGFGGGAVQFQMTF